MPEWKQHTLENTRMENAQSGKQGQKKPKSAWAWGLQGENLCKKCMIRDKIQGVP